MPLKLRLERAQQAFRRLEPRVRILAAAALAAGLVAAIVVSAWTVRRGYAVYRLTRGVGDTWFLGADGKPWFRMDEQRQDVPLARIAPDLQHAFIAVEDRRFYRHAGIDPIALGRAALHDVRAGGTPQGGSTLTQQLARTLFLSNERTFGRKIREATIAVMIETALTKQQILELYLNRIYLSAGVYGVETMSRRLFRKPASSLNLAESALIAGLARAPSALSPWTNLDGAIARSHVVLAKMRDEGFITPDQDRQARMTRLQVRPFLETADRRAGYAKEYLRQLFRDQFGGDHPPDWQVRTTFDPQVQAMAERAVADGLQRLHQPDLQAALIALDPRNGSIVALVGGRDFMRSPFNRAVRSKRQPGSAFKPFLFAAALERGFSPVSVLDGLRSIPPQGPDEWTPRNAHGQVADALTLRAALIESDNRAAAALQQRIGARPVLRLASAAGLRDQPDVPSLSLGTGVVTPIELTAAYAMFPNGGYAVRPRGIVEVLDADGGVAYDNPPQTKRVISPQVAYQMVSLLTDVINRGTAAAARQWGVRVPAGGKTGTTDGFKDAWFVGFTSSLVVGVWVGFDEPRTIGPNAYAARYALPIWSDFIPRATTRRHATTFDMPSQLQEVPLCNVSYLRPTKGCPTYVEYFKEEDAIPRRLCPVHPATIKQEVRRTVEGVLSQFGKQLKHIFKFN